MARDLNSVMLEGVAFDVPEAVTPPAGLGDEYTHATFQLEHNAGDFVGFRFEVVASGDEARAIVAAGDGARVRIVGRLRRNGGPDDHFAASFSIVATGPAYLYAEHLEVNG